jgi:integrase
MLYLNVKVPADLQKVAAGRRVGLPVGDDTPEVAIGATHVKLSLRTKDLGTGKTRFIIAHAALTAFWDALRRGPQPLTHKERVALAGEVRARIVATYDSDPGDPALWRDVQRVNAFIKDGTGILPGRQAGEVATPAEMADYRYGRALDALLAERRMILDPTDRPALIEAVARAMDEAAAVNLRKAEGDYSPDTGAARYPALDAPGTKPSPRLTFATLFGFWEREHLAEGKRVRTAKDFRHKLDSLAAFVGHDNAAAVTKANISDWLDHLRHDKGLAAQTVGQKYLAAVKAIYGLAADKSKVAANPCGGLKSAKVKRQRTRPKGFTDDEAKSILTCALRDPATLGRMLPLNKLAIRWTPWIGAYTGARITELTQLRKVDFVTEYAVPCIRLTPEAGSVKSGNYRLVPVHPHLLEMGIEALFRESKTEYLFFDPRATKLAPADRASAVSGKVSEWVRNVAGVTDPKVQPTHGWRHRFRTVGRDIGIDPEYLDAMQGHEDGRAAVEYGDTTMKALHREVLKLPRYPVE